MKIGCNNALQHSAEAYSEPFQKSQIKFLAQTLGYNFISNMYVSTFSVHLQVFISGIT